MAAFKKYRLNSETLLYEIEKVSAKSRILKAALTLALFAALMGFYLWLFTGVLGIELPKTTLLKRKNAEWVTRMELINRKLDGYDAALEGLRMRDDEVYRNIFGLDEISPALRGSGFGGVNRYADLEGIDEGSLLRRTAVRLDYLMKKAYVQSTSFDEVDALSRKAGDMVSSIPAIMPINPNPSTFRRSSTFGYRSDPFTGAAKMHSGYDFSCPPGNKVYATGDGVVKEINFDLYGYGNSIVIDHGFGYETRYAHLKSIYVSEGMKVLRGEEIGETGNSGRSTGPHLHYEVEYRGAHVNPQNYFDFDMPEDEFRAIVKHAAEMTENVHVGPNMRAKIQQKKK